jgi:hypothetical protein
LVLSFAFEITFSSGRHPVCPALIICAGFTIAGESMAGGKTAMQPGHTTREATSGSTGAILIYELPS